MEADVKGFFEKEMGNPRTRSLAKKEIEKNGKQAGEYVLEELKKTVDFLEKRFGLDKKQAREWFKKCADIDHDEFTDALMRAQ